MSPEGFLAAHWPAPANVSAMITLRTGPGVSSAPFDHFNLGLSCGDAPSHVQENRARLVSELQLPSAPTWLQQIHGVTVARVTNADAADGISADASVTSAVGIVLAVLSADCLPVLFCSEDGSEIAAAHAGWHGLSAGVLEATVRAMHTPASKLLAWLGPAAGPSAYEVGVEVREAFLAGDSRAASAFVATRDRHWQVDLYALARQRLAGLGLKHVFGGEHCTITEAARFYSHRRDGRTGRMASLIWMR